MVNNISDLLTLRRTSTQIAIKQGDRHITYQQWYNHAQHLKECLIPLLPADSCHVALVLPNSIEFAIAYFGVLYAGRVVVPISIGAKGLEITSTLINCEIDLIITVSPHADFMASILLEYPYNITLMTINDYRTYNFTSDKNYIGPVSTPAGLLPKTTPLPNGQPNDVAVMLHTSGTLSHPKRVMLTHANILSNIQSNVESLKLTSQDVVLIGMPMNFGYCHTAQFLTHLYLGASMVIMEGMFLPKKFFQLVQEEHITNFTGVPTMLLTLMEYRYKNRYDIHTLRYICFGGGKMPTDKLQTLIKTFPAVGFVQTYGQTEASPRITALLPEDSLRKLGSVGKPIPGVSVVISGENGRLPEAGNMGEILAQGGNIMKGYFKNEEATKKTIIDGWLHTGDIGYFDEEGYLFLTGRIKNIIISGGINIYPEEVEEVLLGHPTVADALVYGAADDYLGEAPRAKIVAREGESVSEDDLINYCLDKLSSYKVPTRIDFVRQLARTYNGKIKRNEGFINV